MIAGRRHLQTVGLAVICFGCWPAWRLERPEMTFRVNSKSDGRPLNANVTVVAVSDPGLVIGSRVDVQTVEGTVHVDQQRTTQVEACAPHGAGHYYVVWCVSSQGFKPQYGRVEQVGDAVEIKSDLVKASGPLQSCPADSKKVLEHAMVAP